MVTYAETPNHKDVAATVSALAGVREQQGRLDEAAAGYERVRRIEEEVYADQPDHHELATTIHNLAGVYEALGRLPEAAEAYERSLLMYECYHFEDGDHPVIATALHNLASVHEQQGRLTEAADEYARALRKKEVAHERRNPEGRARYARGTASPLAPPASQVAHEKEADHSNLSVTVYNLASVHEAMGRLPEAAMGYERGGNPIPRLHRHLHLLSSLLLLPLLSASA